MYYVIQWLKVVHFDVEVLAVVTLFSGWNLSVGSMPPFCLCVVVFLTLKGSTAHTKSCFLSPSSTFQPPHLLPRSLSVFCLLTCKFLFWAYKHQPSY